MKALITTIAVLLLITITAFGQVDSTQTQKMEKPVKEKNKEEIQTIFGKDVSHGGYMAFTVNYSQIDKKDALLVGARGGWLIDHSIMIGLGGYGFANDIYIDNVVNGDGFNLVGGYGGLVIEPIIFPKFPVHISVPVLFGVGGMAYNTKHYDAYDPDDWSWYTEDSDAFLVLEPGVELELNVLKHFRIAFGATYRKAFDIDLINTKDDVLDDLSYGISFKIGKF